MGPIPIGLSAPVACVEVPDHVGDRERNVLHIHRQPLTGDVAVAVHAYSDAFASLPHLAASFLVLVCGVTVVEVLRGGRDGGGGNTGVVVMLVIWGNSGGRGITGNSGGGGSITENINGGVIRGGVVV